MNVVPLIVIGVVAVALTGLVVLAMAVEAVRESVAARRAIRAIAAWQEQLPGLEPVPACPDCRVIVFPDGQTERVPCQWHADIASQAIERQVSQ